MLHCRKLLTFLTEKSIFTGVLLINIVLICSLKFIPSMDGPAHLYNSNILLSLVKGDPGTVKDFFTVNTFFIPNWISHFLLAGFRILLPAWLAEKLLMLLYITGLAFSFRLLLKKLNPDNMVYSVMIFPFIYSFLFHLGFYNYCLSFIFFFYTIYYWIKTSHDILPVNTLILLLLFTLTYYSGLLTFLFLGLCLGILILSETIMNFAETKVFISATRRAFLALFQLFIAALPGLILFALFYARTQFPSSPYDTDSRVLIKWINDVRPLIVYHYVNEEIITEQIFHILLAIMAISLYTRFTSLQINKLRLNDFLIIPALIALILLFIIPSGGYAGMMSDRLALMFFMIAIVLILSQQLPRKISYIFIPLILIIHFTILMHHYNTALGKLNQDAVMIHDTADKIPEGSIVLPVDMSENWLEPHFSNYLGAEKDLIILDNYEASAGWFPVRWNAGNMPDIMLGVRSSVNGITWQRNPQTRQTRQIDYIFLYGKTELLETDDFRELKLVVSNEYDPVYRSDNEYIRLFRRKQEITNQ